MSETTKHIRLHRDTKGEVRPLGGVSPNLGIQVEVKPLTYGESRLYSSFGDALFEWTDEDKMNLINNNIVTADGKAVEIKDLDDMYENFDAWTIEDLVQAVFLYSGMGRLYSPDDNEGNAVDEVEQDES